MVADATSVTVALLVAAAVLAVGAVAGLRTPMPDTTKLDRTPSTHWPAPQLIFTPDAADGPVLVTVTYRVPEDNAVAFTEAMGHVGRSRRRTGALRWELFRDGGDATRFVESYLVGTWAEHLRQHENRLTGADRRFEEQARRYTRRRAGGRPPVPAVAASAHPVDGRVDRRIEAVETQPAAAAARGLGELAQLGEQRAGEVGETVDVHHQLAAAAAYPEVGQVDQRGEPVAVEHAARDQSGGLREGLDVGLGGQRHAERQRATVRRVPRGGAWGRGAHDGAPELLG